MARDGVRSRHRDLDRTSRACGTAVYRRNRVAKRRRRRTEAWGGSGKRDLVQRLAHNEPARMAAALGDVFSAVMQRKTAERRRQSRAADLAVWAATTAPCIRHISNCDRRHDSGCATPNYVAQNGVSRRQPPTFLPRLERREPNALAGFSTTLKEERCTPGPASFVPIGMTVLRPSAASRWPLTPAIDPLPNTS